ncbi:transposase [Kocuria sp. CCUG 69068]|uniref:transposase n=1 Tax=Kocuria sp. CCUG 69068 TaxID=2043138 RepID=UPI00351CF5F4
MDDRLWELIAPLIPPLTPPRGPGRRPWIDDRAAVEGILFVLHTSVSVADLPPALGRGSGHNRLVACARVTGGRGLREAPPGRARGALRGADPRLDRGQHRLGVGTNPKRGAS